MNKIRPLFFLVLILATGFLITTPVQASAKWWDKFGEPRYGNKINVRVKELSTVQFDTAGPPSQSGQWQLYFDYLFIADWTIDPETWTFQANYNPVKYMVGSLVETWDMPDMQTLVMHLRQGVHFQDKAPVNGREFTADDVVYHFNRLCGTGDGFTKPSPFHAMFVQNFFQSATADDRYTVTIRFKQPTVINLEYLAQMGPQTSIEAPEVTRQHGDLTDWKNAVGTGPWVLTGYTEGSALHFEKNPDYWGYDERHPGNRLPYADNLVVTAIPDDTTALAALRTGKIDILHNIGWHLAQTLAKKNPELKQIRIPKPGTGLIINLNNAPFTDINVRKALQLSVDMQTIAKSYYNDTIDGTPCTIISPLFTDHAYPYNEWPKELRDEYGYNKDKAKQLLADAGYPDGFKTTCVCSNSQDLQLLQIIKAQFMEIGVDMEIITYDIGAYVQLIMSGKHKGLAGPTPSGYGRTDMPWTAVSLLSSLTVNPTTIKDPVYDDMARKILESTDFTDLSTRLKEAQRYVLEQHWGIECVPQMSSFTIYRPSLKGYSGELVSTLGGGNMGYFARWWLSE